MASSHEIAAFIVITIIVIALLVLLYVVNKQNRTTTLVGAVGGNGLTASEIKAAEWFGAFATLLGIVLWIYLIYTLFSGGEHPPHHPHHHGDHDHVDLHRHYSSTTTGEAPLVM